MAKMNIAAASRIIGRLLLVGLVVGLTGFLVPAAGLAAPPEPDDEGPEQCGVCHVTEMEAWQDSPHARALTDIDESMRMACSEGTNTTDCNCLGCHTTDFDWVEHTYTFGGVSCQACHGPYVEDHPKEGVMNLDADSSVCSDCHTETYQQWQESLHAQVGVQCIGCHQSHSQDFRLTDEALCGACHRDQVEDFTHTAHETADVGCTDCHLSSATSHQSAALASAASTSNVGPGAAPSHSFTVVTSQACVGCHSQGIHQVVPCDDLTLAANAELMAAADQLPELTTKLEAAEKSNRTLRVMTLVTLGWGMGIGSILGIFFVLVVGYATQRRTKQ